MTTVVLVGEYKFFQTNTHHFLKFNRSGGDEDFLESVQKGNNVSLTDRPKIVNNAVKKARQHSRKMRARPSPPTVMISWVKATIAALYTPDFTVFGNLTENKAYGGNQSTTKW